MPEGTAMTIEFQIEGGISGPHAVLFQINEAISFIVIGHPGGNRLLLDKLSAGGDEKSQMCGWLKRQIRGILAGCACCAGRYVSRIRMFQKEQAQ